MYLAQDLKHDRKVAVKGLRPELGAERFRREIKTTAYLRHSHILPLYDSGCCTTAARGGDWRAVNGRTGSGTTRSPAVMQGRLAPPSGGE